MVLVYTLEPPQCVKQSPQFLGELRGLLLLIVADADEVAGGAERVSGEVEPVGAGEELVGVFPGAEEGYQGDAADDKQHRTGTLRDFETFLFHGST